jgi:exoribonuclease R
MTALPPPPLVGVLELASKYRYGLTSRGIPLYLFRPYDESRPQYIVGSSERDLSRNQIAVVEAPPPDAPAPPAHGHIRANLIRLLGPVGDPVAERAGLLQYYCPVHAKLVAATATASTAPDTSDDHRRMEIDTANGWTVFHVDPAGCRDIDDAIAFHPATGRWATIIADVAAAIPAMGPLNARARAIGATFYDLEGRVVRPMLPPEISEDAASLLPGQRRRGVALITDPVSADAATEPAWVFCWTTVAHSFSYESFATSDLAASLHITTDPHDWIAERMIAYNAAAGRTLKSASQGLLRVQPPADAAAVTTWPASLRHLANEHASYQVADVTATNQGHTGLGLPAYAHASSPLRRFADLVNQRALKILIAADGAGPTAPPELADHLNSRTAANRRWTRDLTFLTHVTPGKVHEIDVVPLSATQVWVPLWGRLLRLRHEVPVAPTRIAIYCDPTRPNWKMRVLTAPASTGSSSDSPTPRVLTAPVPTE